MAAVKDYKKSITCSRSGHYTVIVRHLGVLVFKRGKLGGLQSAHFEADQFIEKHKGSAPVMKTFNITSRASGLDLGDYDGATPADALDSMARDAGYHDAAHADAQIGPSDDDLIVTECDSLDGPALHYTFESAYRAYALSTDIGPYDSMQRVREQIALGNIAIGAGSIRDSLRRVDHDAARFAPCPKCRRSMGLLCGLHSAESPTLPVSKTDKQVCTLRELVLAQAAYERAASEFTASILPEGQEAFDLEELEVIEGAVNDICQSLSDPRDVCDDSLAEVLAALASSTNDIDEEA